MTLLYTSSAFQQHITGVHPEHPRRLVAVEQMLDATGLRAGCAQPQWQPATAAQIDRVVIVDWDVHPGNGTQEIFWDDGRVGFLSIHRWPFYPGTGDSDETGGGPGLGLIANVPVQLGTPLPDYHARFERALADVA